MEQSFPLCKLEIADSQTLLATSADNDGYRLSSCPVAFLDIERRLQATCPVHQGELPEEFQPSFLHPFYKL